MQRNTMYHITKPMGVTPKWALDYRMKQDKWVAGFDLEEFFSMDASYLVDSLGKGMSDMYEDEGIAYVIGNVGTNIATWKFLGELKNVKASVVANETYDIIGTTTVFDFDSGMFLEAEIVRKRRFTEQEIRIFGQVEEDFVLRGRTDICCPRCGGELIYTRVSASFSIECENKCGFKSSVRGL